MLIENVKEVFLRQKSDEWLNWRKERICASDVAAIANTSPYNSMNSVMDSKLYECKNLSNEYIVHGELFEPICRREINLSFNEQFTPKCFEGVMPIVDNLDKKIDQILVGASLDGISKDGKKILEIKCPKTSTTSFLLEKETIPLSYLYQMSWQFALSGAKRAFLTVYIASDFIDNDKKAKPIADEYLYPLKKTKFYKVQKDNGHVLWVIEPTKAALNSILKKIKPFVVSFWKELKQNKAKNHSKINYLEETEELLNAFSCFKEAKKESELIQKKLKSCQEKLMNLIKNDTEKYNKVELKDCFTVTALERKGTIDMAKVAKHFNKDVSFFETFRKSSTKQSLLKLKKE